MVLTVVGVWIIGSVGIACWLPLRLRRGLFHAVTRRVRGRFHQV